MSRTRFYRDSDIRLDEQIDAAEKRLDALYAKRAGRRNSRAGEPIYGWAYCDCGRTNQLDGYVSCRHCIDRSEAERLNSIVVAHDLGDHAIAPLDGCTQCYGKRMG